MAKFRGKKSTAALVKKVRKRKPTAYKMTKPMKTQVQKLIDSNLETKYKCEPAFGGSASDYTNHSFSFSPQQLVLPGGQKDLIKLIPAIAQGTGNAERIGDQVNLQSLRCRFHFSISPGARWETENSLFHCRLLIISCKKLVKYADLVNNWTSGLQLKNDLLKPAGDGENFKCDPYSITWPVNRELFTVHAERRFVMTRGAKQGDDQSNIHMPSPIKVINVNLKVKSKRLKYTEDATEGATNYAPFGILLYAPQYGNIPSTTAVGPIVGNCSSCITWQD